jgi:hypothetical protein
VPRAGAPQDYLYVGVRGRSAGYAVLVYDTGSLKAVRRLSTEDGNSRPMLLAFDLAGNLYASSQTFDATSTITVRSREYDDSAQDHKAIHHISSHGVRSEWKSLRPRS